MSQFVRYSPANARYDEAVPKILILVAVILLLANLCYLRIQTLSVWILNSSFYVLTATSITNDRMTAARSERVDVSLFK